MQSESEAGGTIGKRRLRRSSTLPPLNRCQMFSNNRPSNAQTFGAGKSALADCVVLSSRVPGDHGRDEHDRPGGLDDDLVALEALIPLNEQVLKLPFDVI